MKKFSHLHNTVKEALELPIPERIAFCLSDRWIGYTGAIQILNRLDDLMIYPNSLHMPNVLVVGDGGNGKTAIIECFVNRHPIQISPAGAPIAPILLIQMPGTPNESEVWSSILWALGIHHKDDTASLKKRQAKAIMRYVGVRILVIDDFNNLVNAGKDAGNVLAAIKGLCDELKITIVAAGTQVAMNILNSDPQMKSRSQPVVLDRWQLNNEYLRFLASYERLLPLAEASGLATRELAPQIYHMAGDMIGNTVYLLKKAAAEAIETKTERITIALLESLNWARPGDWSQVAQRV